MNTVFDIRTYGAAGDGVTDDTEAIRAALADASLCRGTVVAPPGRYVTGKLKMGPGVRLEGRSAWSFRSFGASEFLLRDGEDDCMIDITGAFGASIAGMSLNGRNLGKNVHGVKLYWEKYNGGSEEDTPTLDDCRIGDFTGDGVHLEHIWCFSVRHCMLCHNGGAGLFMDGWDGFILDNWLSGNRKYGLYASPCGASVTATGNRVEWNRAAGFCVTGGDSWNVTGNFFDRSFGPALRFSNVRDCAVTGNVFRRSGKPEWVEFTSPYDSSQIFLTDCTNVTVTGNTFAIGRDDGGKGVWSPDYGAVLVGCRQSVFASNAMHRGSLKENIIAENCTDTEITGNTGTPAGEMNGYVFH